MNEDLNVGMQNFNGVSEGLNYYNPSASDNALKTRLETEDTLEKVEMYLRGESWSYDENNNLVKIRDDSQAKANEKGCRAIMSAVSSYINKSAVQGNLTDSQIGLVMNDFHRGMANLFAFHCQEWGIDKNERKSIVNFIEPFVFMFISRTKDNKERESYGMTIKETGRQLINNASKRFGIF